MAISEPSRTKVMLLVAYRVQCCPRGLAPRVWRARVDLQPGKDDWERLVPGVCMTDVYFPVAAFCLFSVPTHCAAL